MIKHIDAQEPRRTECARRERGDQLSESHVMNDYLGIENAEGYLLIAVYLFIYLFVCVLLA